MGINIAGLTAGLGGANRQRQFQELQERADRRQALSRLMAEIAKMPNILED